MHVGWVIYVCVWGGGGGGGGVRGEGGRDIFCCDIICIMERCFYPVCLLSNFKLNLFDVN